MEITFFQNNLSSPATLIPAIIKESHSYFELKAFKEYNPAFHKINYPYHRPDKITRVPDPEGGTDQMGNPKTMPVSTPVTRLAIPLQKLIVSRESAFLTGGEVKLKANNETDAETTLYDAVRKTWRENKMQFKNNAIAQRVLSETECAEIWYNKSTDKNEINLRCKVFSPSDGYELFPTYDNYGDLMAFGLQWEDAKVKKTRYFDLYTAEYRTRYLNTGSGWEVAPSTPDFINPFPLPYGKIPVIYYQQPQSTWQDVQSMIERLETMISNFCDTNDYNGSPILFAKGEIKGFATKGEAGKMIESEGPDADLKYVTWESVPEAIKFEMETLMRMIFSCTQTPDISFEAMKSLGDISGVAFDRIMIDAHLKATASQTGWFGEGIQRRLNFLTEALRLPSQGDNSNLEITPVFSLFRINAEADRIETAIKGNGGAPVMSQEEAIEYVGLSPNPAKSLENIKAEATTSGIDLNKK